ncbi:hypothetical protein BC828DRAFT_390394 [Blastocladiella britannica]|nr:hypothetical protein BC828DRAFT_390394 [Blastocladiella britannica]
MTTQQVPLLPLLLASSNRLHLLTKILVLPSVLRQLAPVTLYLAVGALVYRQCHVFRHNTRDLDLRRRQLDGIVRSLYLLLATCALAWSVTRPGLLGLTLLLRVLTMAANHALKAVLDVATGVADTADIEPPTGTGVEAAMLSRNNVEVVVTLTGPPSTASNGSEQQQLQQPLELSDEETRNLCELLLSGLSDVDLAANADVIDVHAHLIRTQSGTLKVRFDGRDDDQVVVVQRTARMDDHELL